MNDLKPMKEDYMKHTASDALRARITATLHDTPEAAPEPGPHESRKRPWRSLAALAASLLLLLTATLNLSPAFADTVAKVPGMAGVVRVLTLGRYVVEEAGFQAHIETPSIEGLVDKALQDKLNGEFRDESEALIAAFEADMEALKAQFPKETVHMGVDSGYTVRTDTADYLTLDVYSVNVVGSSSTTHKFYTVDKRTGQLVTLPSLFKDGADYVTPISAYLLAEMRRQNAAGESVYWTDEEMGENFRSIRPDQNFFINDQGQLVIAFDKYEAGPGSSGCPEFVIPQAVVAEILK